MFAGLRDGGRRSPFLVLLAVAAPLGLALGIGGLLMHLQADPLVDVRAYYDAGARLNAGLPLYDTTATSPTGLYLYPPLLAILFRPLALLPFEVAAAIWETVIVAAFGLVLWRAGLRPVVVLAVAVLALPISWALAIGQAEPLVTLALAFPTPLSVALAGHLKLAPLVVAVWWLARREVGWLVRLAACWVALAVLQLVLAPDATLAYARLEWLRPAIGVQNISPFAVHPALWVALVAVLAVLAWTRARARDGWAWAVALAVLVYPRLLAYQLMTLLAAFGGPRERVR
jgi:hypothetical protein